MKKQKQITFNQIIKDNNMTEQEAIKCWEYLRSIRVQKLLKSMELTIKPNTYQLC